MCNPIKTIVIDNGTFYCRAGFGIDEVPHIIVPTIVGNVSLRKTHYIGNELQSIKASVKLINPIERGCIVDWDNMEKIWDSDDGLKVGESNKYKIISTISTFAPYNNKTKTAEIFFEKFNATSLAIPDQNQLALYSFGRVSGTVVNCGHGITQVSSFVNGERVAVSLQSVKIGGADVTDYLEKMLIEKGYQFDAQDRAILHEIKEQLCSIPLHYNRNNPGTDDDDSQTFKLPDGRSVTIGKERFQCHEILFQPSLLSQKNPNKPGVHKLINRSISSVYTINRRDLYENILLTGGITKCAGFTKRLEKELSYHLIPPRKKYKIISNKTLANNQVWIGGSILASDLKFNNCFLDRNNYNECGPGALFKLPL